MSDQYCFNFIFMRRKKRYTLCTIVHLPMMIILIYLCFIIKFHVSLLFSQIFNQLFLGIFCHNILKQSENYVSFDFRFRSTLTFKDTNFTLPKSSKHQKVEEYQWSTDRGDLDLNSDVK